MVVLTFGHNPRFGRKYRRLPAPIPPPYSDQIECLKSLVLDSVASAESKRAYGKGI